MSLLQQFNTDSHTRAELIDFIHQFIGEKALERLYKGEDVTHIKDAKDLIDGAFEYLDITYGAKKSTTTQTNESR